MTTPHERAALASVAALVADRMADGLWTLTSFKASARGGRLEVELKRQKFEGEPRRGEITGHGSWSLLDVSLRWEEQMDAVYESMK